MTLAVLALVLQIRVHQDMRTITLRYPALAGVTWIEVCVESEGHGDAGKGEDPYPWYQQSCWTPRFALEDDVLPENAYHVRAHLTIEQNGERSVIWTPVWQVRPEETGRLILPGRKPTVPSSPVQPGVPEPPTDTEATIAVATE